ncbi:hypothetical protein TorRG33x02_206530 [Trema orientale]|uniref:Uncharacterized protein n=1 Tax=Trema orientale TaxID=63057 RepID=A0A2P5ED86_TREOI|nr:hypothetical protein TorRG33x02_206530 [Trema orientale]
MISVGLPYGVVSQILVLGTFLQKIVKLFPSTCVHGHYLLIRERENKEAWYCVVKIACDTPKPSCVQKVGNGGLLLFVINKNYSINCFAAMKAVFFFVIKVVTMSLVA